MSEACGLALAGELEEEILKLGYENVMMHCRRGWELRWSMSRFNLKMRLLLIRRPAQWFAVNHWNVVLDIMVLAKGIASGFPMAAVVARKELMQKCLPGKHGSTYGGNPVACASALASIQVIEDEGLLENAREMGAYLSNSLRRLACEHKFIGDVRGFGLMLGIELIDSEGQPAGKRLAAVVEACVERRLLLLDCGSYDHVIRFLPPLNVSRAELDEGLSIFADALKAVSLFTAT